MLRCSLSSTVKEEEEVTGLPQTQSGGQQAAAPNQANSDGHSDEAP